MKSTDIISSMDVHIKHWIVNLQIQRLFLSLLNIDLKVDTLLIRLNDMSIIWLSWYQMACPKAWRVLYQALAWEWTQLVTRWISYVPKIVYGPASSRTEEKHSANTRDYVPQMSLCSRASSGYLLAGFRYWGMKSSISAPNFSA